MVSRMKTRNRPARGPAMALMLFVLAGSVLAPAAPLAADPVPKAPAPEAAAGTGPAAWDLETVVGIALANHPLVHRDDEETAAAAARKAQARSAYYPSMSLSSGYSEFEGFSASSGLSVSTSRIVAEGGVSHVIADFGRRRAGVREAGSELSASRETGRATRRDVAFQAKAAYFGVLRAGSLLSVSRETVAQREALLRQAAAFYEAGIRARIDVARAEANLYQARAELTAAENDLRVARITLLNRMGIDGPRDFELADTTEAETEAGTVEEWVREAEENRPELRALIHRQRAAESAVRAARAEHLPILSANGGYGYDGEEFPLRRTHNVSLLFELPVFSGFLTSERVREAEASLASAGHALTDLLRRVRLEVEQGALSMEESRDRIAARTKELEASRENLRLATGRYEVGAGDIIEMIDAQVQNARAESGRIEALYDHRIAVAFLLRAVGR